MTMQKTVLSVSQLNRQVKNYLENEIGILHVEGEISNLSKPSSGHFYFTLKDSGAQIRCVFFKNRHFGPLPAKLGDGQKIIASGKLSLYEARGDYQLIVEQITEAGLGELYQKFEALKTKLALEGLFHSDRKKSLPRIPKTIGIITSANGAALRDILSTLARRYPLAHILIYPSEVQGASAAQQLQQALQRADKDNRCDVLILARGGGSIEDLWPFNDESLARQIASLSTPIVSGVGHETDFTIADFVADYRAETPTAAACAVSPDCMDLLKALHYYTEQLQKIISRQTQSYRLKLNHLIEKISSPQQAIGSYWQTIDYMERHLLSAFNQKFNQKKHQLHLLTHQLQVKNPKTQIVQNKQRLELLHELLIQNIRIQLSHMQHRMRNSLSTLHAVSPLATLDRGYAIANHSNKILFSSRQVTVGDTIQVRLSKGTLACAVTEIKE